MLFDLPGFRVVSCEETSSGRRAVVMQTADEHACPRCGVLVDGRPYDVRESRIKDLPMGHRPLAVIWRKRRYRCVERGCPQRVFTERSEQLPPRHRLTARLRAKLEDAASRARVSSSPSIRTGGGAAAARSIAATTSARCTLHHDTPYSAATSETTRAARSLRWGWEDGAGWRLSNPWMQISVRPG